MPDKLPILRTCLSKLWRAGAIAPSGAVLAKSITREILPQDSAELEFSSGTTVFTPLWRKTKTGELS